LIVTLGGAGSVIHSRGEEILIPAAPVREVVDPTGCGDAFRAGLIHGLLHGHDWRTTGRIASLMGAIKVESRGTQNHRFTGDEFAQRLATAFA
jgi:adenosine kinase